jgi:transcription-repair coupling factor (superfamily II helicase)
MAQPLAAPPFLKHLQGSALLTAATAHVPEIGNPIYVKGLSGSLAGVFASQWHKRHERQLVVISHDNDLALEIWSDVSLLLGEERTVYVGAQRRGAIDSRSLDNEFAEHADVLRNIAQSPARVVVTDAETYVRDFPSVQEISEQSVRLDRFASFKQDELVKRLAYGGFERGEYVSSNGEFAVRGGIVDVFPIGVDNPLRIEFFGDEIDSIRQFDALSQRSIGQLDTISFVASLFIDGPAGARSLMHDFLAGDAVFFVVEPDVLRRCAEDRDHAPEIMSRLESSPRFVMSVIDAPAGGTVIDVHGAPQPSFNGSVALLRDDITQREAEGQAIFLIADSEQQARRLDDLLTGTADEEETPGVRHSVAFVPLARGFLLPDAKLVVYTEHQIFNRQRIQKRVRKGIKGLSLREMKQLHPGDYVVHVDKGIGKFSGFHTIKVAGGMQETAKILYADGDALYVNLNYLGRLQKYSSEEGAEPKLSKLGTGEWDRLKERTKKRLKDIARDLITLYAQRKVAKGFAFSPDGHWQREMEASFMYEDTPDQHQATVDVKRDMEEAVPMDRLVCGDVGYGKTEVAVRAAFKAVLDGKQVAVLVPTTILAQQHYNTFQDRLHRYSVVVEALSRFKNASQQKDVLDRLVRGKVDIVIGTHRLLSKDVGFKDIGLLIVDEEHRFGVAAKEKLRQLRANIDTLTLTATPIPRTLNFSLLGARDLSVIETPPRNRLPIITSIVPFDRDVVIEGLQRELERGGQVYFVSDRIGDLEQLADKLRVFVPHVRIGIAHGQIKGPDLERMMMRFMEKKIDVLVTTKIVESGLDIPNANTIFINRADRFGLAELYQLRGRVGRSNTQAYAYLLVPPEAKMSTDALKRLQAIEEFSELGTGFQLSMRDMEIRGAGNLLGGEQSGFITEIGFELYMSTLEEAVSELKHDEFQGLFAEPEKAARPRPDVVMELGLDAFLPQEYVRSSTERFDLYRRLYDAESAEGIKEVEDEIFDRFGLFPPETENLLRIVRMRLIAAHIRLARVTWEAPVLTLVFPPESDAEFYDRHFQPMVQWIMDRRNRMKLEQDRTQVRVVVTGVASLDDVSSLLADLLATCSTEDAADIAVENQAAATPGN